jgi:Rab-GTPase-TBC domain
LILTSFTVHHLKLSLLINLRRYSTAALTYDLNLNEGYRGEISRDVSRTFPFHPLFFTAADRDELELKRSSGTGSGGLQPLTLSLGERMLSNVLLALAIARPNVGYCQGMNFVVGGLLIVGTAAGRTSSNSRTGVSTISFAEYLDAETDPEGEKASNCENERCKCDARPEEQGVQDAAHQYSTDNTHRCDCNDQNGTYLTNGTIIDDVKFSSGYLLLVEALVFSIVLNIIGDNNVSTNTSPGSKVGRSSTSKNHTATSSNKLSTSSSDSNTNQIALESAAEALYDRFGTGNKSRSGLAMWGMWQSDVPRMKRRVFQFDRLLKWTLPRLHAHLLEVELAPEIIVAQWLGTLFAYSLPLSFVTEVWNYVFSSEIDLGLSGEEGGWSAVFRVAMALLCDREKDILEMDLQELSGLLRKWSFKDSDNARILEDAHSLSSRINEEVLLRLEQDFALEVLSHNSPISALQTSTARLMYGEKEASEGAGNRGWLSRYSKPNTRGFPVNREEVKLMRIKEDLVQKLEQSEADKQVILLKILKACESLRRCSLLTKIAEEEHVRHTTVQCNAVQCRTFLYTFIRHIPDISTCHCEDTQSPLHVVRLTYIIRVYRPSLTILTG